MSLIVRANQRDKIDECTSRACNENGDLSLNGHKLRVHGEALEAGEGQKVQGVIINNALRTKNICNKHYGDMATSCWADSGCP